MTMKTTNIETLKLNIIDHLLRINDINVFSQIETIIEKSESKEFKKFTKKQLIERAQKANDDIENGHITSHNAIKLLSKNG